MVEGHVSDARPIEYLEWKLSEGLYEDVATLCETLIRLEKDSEAAALYDWSVSITQPYVQPLPDGSEISDLLYFRCHRPETAQRDYFSAQRLAAPSFAKLYAAHDAGNFAALETLLLAVGANAGSDALLYLAQRDTDPALYAVVERFLTQLRTYEDEIRPDAAFDADSFAKRAMMLRLAYGFDGAEADFARIDNPVEKADALISALWALDPEPKYFAFLEGDATVWYFSKVAAIPGFYTH